jgi:hypothetical protein
MPPTVPNPEARPTPGNTTLLTALASGPGRGSNGSGQLWPRRTSHRVRDSGPQGPARVHAGGRRTVGCRTPSEPQTAADTRMATTPARPRMLNTAFQTAAVQRAADGQSADRSSALKLVCSSQGRPCEWPPRTVTDADVAVCSRGSWSAHANAMGPGYLYCARRGFASDDVCTLPMVSCSVGPSRRARGIRARGIMVSCCSGGCGSNDLPRQGQNLDPAVAPWAFWFASRLSRSPWNFGGGQYLIRRHPPWLV